MFCVLFLLEIMPWCDQGGGGGGVGRRGESHLLPGLVPISDKRGSTGSCRRES